MHVPPLHASLKAAAESVVGPLSVELVEVVKSTCIFQTLSEFDPKLTKYSGAPEYFVNFGSNSLNVWKMHVDFTTSTNSTLSGPTTLSAAAFSEACNGGTCIPQSGTTQTLDSLADRLMYRLAYRHFADGHEALVVNHSVNPGTTAKSGIRWYELRIS